MADGLSFFVNLVSFWSFEGLPLYSPIPTYITAMICESAVDFSLNNDPRRVGTNISTIHFINQKNLLNLKKTTTLKNQRQMSIYKTNWKYTNLSVALHLKF